MVNKEKWMKIINELANEKKIKLSSFSQTRLRQMAGDIDGAFEELNEKSGYEMDRREMRKMIERALRQ